MTTLRRSLVAILLAAALALQACSAFRPAFKGELVQPRASAPEIDLPDQDGSTFRLSDRRGSLVLVSFGFTNCVDECPLAMAHLKLARELLGDRASQVQVVLVSTDPVRDTPQAMKDFLARFDPAFVGIPGSPEQLSRIWDAYGVVVLDGGETHSSRIYVVDSAGDLRLRWDPGTPPEDMASDLKRLLTE